MPARIEKVVTSGTFALDGGEWQVDNNVWLVGDDEEVIVIDAAHDAAAIVTAVAGRRVTALVCTHGHDDHIGAAGDLFDATKSPVSSRLRMRRERPSPSTSSWRKRAAFAPIR